MEWIKNVELVNDREKLLRTSTTFVVSLFHHRKYDLKGSTVDREASDKEKGKDLPTLKDNDFLKHGGRIYIGDEAKEKLMETLSADIGVRKRLNFSGFLVFFILFLLRLVETL